jgi:hypothetical protein
MPGSPHRPRRPPGNTRSPNRLDADVTGFGPERYVNNLLWIDPDPGRSGVSEGQCLDQQPTESGRIPGTDEADQRHLRAQRRRMGGFDARPRRTNDRRIRWNRSARSVYERRTRINREQSGSEQTTIEANPSRHSAAGTAESSARVADRAREVLRERGLTESQIEAELSLPRREAPDR